MNEVKHKTAAEFWEKRFGESPRTDSEKLAVAMMTEYELSKELRWTTLRPEFACVFATKKHGEYQIWRFCWEMDESLTGVEYGYYLAWTTNEGDEWDEIEDCDFEEYLVLEILPTMEEVHKDRTDKW